MAVAEDDHVIEALPADRADQSLRMTVLLKVGRRVISDAHRLQTLRDHLTVGYVAISNQIVWCFIPREALGDLAGDPLRRGMGRHRERYQSRSLVPQDDQYGTIRKSIAPMPVEWCVQKGLSGLRPPSPAPRHVLSDRRLGDLNPELLAPGHLGHARQFTRRRLSQRHLRHVQRLEHARHSPLSA